MSEERYTTESMNVKRELVLIKDSQEPIPLNPWECARRLNDLERQLEEARELIKAVAHIGIDWGYGKFELTQDHIDKARKLHEQQTKGKRK